MVEERETPRKLNVMIARFPYGGNGGIATEVPEIADWLASTVSIARKDADKGGLADKIDRICTRKFSDTPITMTRNAAVEAAKAWKADVLVMIDSDQVPDVEAEFDSDSQPFFKTAFDYLHAHYEKGPVVIGAPYVGPAENVYVFVWENSQNSNEHEIGFQIRQYSRHESTLMQGFHPAAALPTGLIMYDMRCFDLITKPYFYYEYTDDSESKKASTEDVTNTRDISLAGVELLGYNPVLCLWSSWAGHWKQDLKRKPRILTAEGVSKKLKTAFTRGIQANQKVVFLGDDQTCALSNEIRGMFPTGPKTNGLALGNNAPSADAISP